MRLGLTTPLTGDGLLPRCYNNAYKQLRKLRIFYGRYIWRDSTKRERIRKVKITMTAISPPANSPMRSTGVLVIKEADASLSTIADQKLFHTTSRMLNSFLFDWLTQLVYQADISAEAWQVTTDIDDSAKGQPAGTCDKLQN